MTLPQSERRRSGFLGSYCAAVDFVYRGNPGRRATHEDLVGDVQLGEVDGSLLNRHSFFARQRQKRSTVDAIENVAGDVGCDEHSVSDEEDVGGTELADVSVDVEENAIVEPTVDGILFRQNGIDVCPVDLRARRNRIVGDATPHTGLQPHTVLRHNGIGVVEEDRHCRVQATDPCSGNGLVDVDGCPHVHLVGRGVGRDDLLRHLHEPFETPLRREGVDADDLAGLDESLVVIEQPESGAPISVHLHRKHGVNTQAVEDGRGRDPECRVLRVHQAIAEIHLRVRECHAAMLVAR